MKEVPAVIPRIAGDSWTGQVHEHYLKIQSNSNLELKKCHVIWEVHQEKRIIVNSNNDDLLSFPKLKKDLLQRKSSWHYKCGRVNSSNKDLKVILCRGNNFGISKELLLIHCLLRKTCPKIMSLYSDNRDTQKLNLP